MDELVAFVRQQLDEDERVARAANPAPWRLEQAGHEALMRIRQG